MKNTVDAISSELTEHGFVLRYVTGETDDGLSGKEGTFLDLLLLVGVCPRHRR
jgi:GH15 family glucan-1,4-alpha-glucosidase